MYTYGAQFCYTLTVNQRSHKRVSHFHVVYEKISCNMKLYKMYIRMSASVDTRTDKTTAAYATVQTLSFTPAPTKSTKPFCLIKDMHV